MRDVIKDIEEKTDDERHEWLEKRHAERETSGERPREKYGREADEYRCYFAHHDDVEVAIVEGTTPVIRSSTHDIEKGFSIGWMRSVTAEESASLSTRTTLPIGSMPGPGTNTTSPSAILEERAIDAFIVPPPAPNTLSGTF